MNLEQFLVKAKISAYANKGERNDVILADSSKELAFKEGQCKYRDRYFGWNPFVGEEIVWQDNKIIWAMNYYGVVSNEVISVNQVYEFLRKAMRQVDKEYPFRGPSLFKEADFEYINKNSGTVEQFTGVEKILHLGQEIYRLNYHGGKIKDK
jgi:hypothetical protein